eukprot:SAG11_NODE_6687_length_1266_cov_1.540703_2_plen_156_part_00
MGQIDRLIKDIQYRHHAPRTKDSAMARGIVREHTGRYPDITCQRTSFTRSGSAGRARVIRCEYRILSVRSSDPPHFWYTCCRADKLFRFSILRVFVSISASTPKAPAKRRASNAAMTSNMSVSYRGIGEQNPNQSWPIGSTPHCQSQVRKGEPKS